MAIAQTFSLEWHAISQGGGKSSGGGYSLETTLGNLQGLSLQGGSFSVDSAFLHGVFVVPATNSPSLSVRISNGDFVLTWPLEGSTGFQLEETATLGNSAAWQPAVGTLGTNGEVKVLIVQPLGLKFYRLTKP